MSKLRMILAAAVLAIMCGFALAQPEGPEGGPGCPGGPDGKQMTPPPGGPGCGPQMREGKPGEEFFKAVNATEEQIEKLKPILEAQKEKMKAWFESNKEKFEAARKAMQEARESKDKEAIAKAKEQLKALGDEGKALHEQFTKDLATVLSAEQMELEKKFWKSKIGNRKPGMRGMDRGHDMFKQLGLTDEQKTKMKAIMDEARTKAQAAETPEAKREIMEAARKQIDSEVLTADQKAKLEQMKQRGDKNRRDGRPGMKDMNPLEGIATPEQMEQAKKIMEDAHKQAAEIMKAARNKVNTEVLNEEQRKALQEKMEQFKKERGDKNCGKGPEGDMSMRGHGPKGGNMEMCGNGPDGKGKGMGMRDGKMRRHNDPLMSILNDDQKAQAKKIMDAAREQAKAAKTPDEKRDIMKAAREKIKKDILTDEQRKQLEEQRKAKKCAAPEAAMDDEEDFGPMARMDEGPADFDSDAPGFDGPHCGPQGPDGFCPEKPEFEPQGPAVDDAE